MKIKMNKKTFTLIELLVVIAIIAILAALLLPALKQAKDLSKLALCTSNLKQVGLALFSYAGNYDEWIPHPKGYDPSWGSGHTWYSTKERRWTGLLSDYFNTETTSAWSLPEGLRCPSCTAGTNVYWCGLNTSFSNKRMTKFGKYPEKSVWFGDTRSSYFLYPNRWTKSYTYRHLDEENALGIFNTSCVDGHIEKFNWRTDDQTAGGKRITRPHEKCYWFKRKL